jgi:hypothetical protein
VVTSNQVVIWHALSLLGIDDRRNCRGRLFDTLRTSDAARNAHAGSFVPLGDADTARETRA